MAPVFQICIGFALLVLTLGIHLFVVDISLRRVASRVRIVRDKGGSSARTGLVLVYVIFLCSALLVEAIVWALAFVSFGVVSGFWTAVYFALVTLTTLGYGDLVPSENAQLVAAFCAVTGLFLVGLSTAFVIEILRRTEAED